MYVTVGILVNNHAIMGRNVSPIDIEPFRFKF